MTFIAALRHDRITAPWFLEGRSTAKPSFSTSKRFWSRPCGQGDIVIMDNLGSHKASAVRRAIRAAGARLFYCRNTRPI